MENNIILSICIPTFNRDKCIKEQLERLSSLDDEILSNIEIIISDNCSQDNSKMIIESFISKFKFVYIRNEENIGGDRNFLQCYSKSTGQYVLLLGDDDFIIKDAIPRLLENLRQEEYGLIHISSSIKRNGLSSKTYIDSEHFLSDIGIWISFMSSNIINRKFIQNIDLTKYIDTYFLQIPIYVYSAEKSKKNLMIYYRLFEDSVMYQTNGGYNIFKVFVSNYIDIFQTLLNEGIISKKLFRNEILISSDSIIPHVFNFLIKRKKSNYDTKGAIKILNKYYGLVPFIFYVVRYIIKHTISKLCHISRNIF